MNLKQWIILAVIISGFCTSCYTVVVKNDDLQQDISVKIAKAHYAIIPWGAIEQIEIMVYNNTIENLYIDWSKSSIQDNYGSHRILRNISSINQIILLEMQPALVPAYGFIRNPIYRMEYPERDYNVHTLVLTLCYRFGSIDSTDEEKFARFILQSTKNNN